MVTKHLAYLFIHKKDIFYMFMGQNGSFPLILNHLLCLES